MSDEPFAKVSQYSRESGRNDALTQLAKMDRERDQLLLEKRTIEVNLAILAGKKRDDMMAVYRRRLGKSESIVATSAVESNYAKEHSELASRKNDIDGRLMAIKNYRRDHRQSDTTKQHKEDIPILLRIESVLTKILESLNRN